METLRMQAVQSPIIPRGGRIDSPKSRDDFSGARGGVLWPAPRGGNSD
jgi:hypothetical protein